MQGDSSVQNHKAIIAYDGTDLLGFQIQSRGRTAQGVLEEALAKIAKKPIRIIGAGRTDAGVHATGQVVAFKLAWKHTLADLQNALNANLPADIAVHELTTTYFNFHPRFDARSRQYKYTILNQPSRDVMKRRYTAHISKPVDVALMQQASFYLVGTHDFASFGRPPQGDNTIRTVSQAEWQVEGSEIAFYITANAFLYKMVRTIVGTLLQIGLGEMDVDELKDILQVKDRSKAGAPAPACGLCLVKVTY